MSYKAHSAKSRAHQAGLTSIWNTPGQARTHLPQPMQLTSSTNTCMLRGPGGSTAMRQSGVTSMHHHVCNQHCSLSCLGIPGTPPLPRPPPPPLLPSPQLLPHLVWGVAGVSEGVDAGGAEPRNGVIHGARCGV